MKKKLVFLTGAGVDKESGVATFRDSDGLWEGHNVMDVASPQGWRKNKQLVLDFYNERRRQLDTVEPNVAHKMIAELEKIFDVHVITQNVTDLHERGGSSKVLHLHGELRKMCSSRNKELTQLYTEDIKVGDMHEDGSQLRPFIVWFGEDVPKLGEAAQIVSEADIVIVVGTSMNVYPAAGLVDYAAKGVKIYYIDPKPNLEFVLVKPILIEKVATEGIKDLMVILSEGEGIKGGPAFVSSPFTPE
jgi:NAD-dependent deacetylase